MTMVILLDMILVNRLVNPMVSMPLISKDAGNSWSNESIHLALMIRYTNLDCKEMALLQSFLCTFIPSFMVKNPNTKITLVGSSENGRQEGLIMAENIKNYSFI